MDIINIKKCLLIRFGLLLMIIFKGVVTHGETEMILFEEKYHGMKI